MFQTDVSEQIELRRLAEKKLPDCAVVCSYSRHDIRRIVGYVTEVVTQNTDKKTSKVVSSLREIA